VSPRTLEDITDAERYVRSLYAADPASAVEYVQTRRALADWFAARNDPNLAATLHLITDAAEDELARLGGAR
jgi:hypothetical protein